MSLLRHIAVTVVEDEEGAFRWRLVELDDERWQLLNEQRRGMQSYQAAMAAGLVALQKMVEDLDLGPREKEAEPRRPAQSATAFGFGFGMPKIG